MSPGCGPVFIDPKTRRQYGAVDSTREGGLIGLPR